MTRVCAHTFLVFRDREKVLCDFRVGIIDAMQRTENNLRFIYYQMSCCEGCGDFGFMMSLETSPTRATGLRAGEHEALMYDM